MKRFWLVLFTIAACALNALSPPVQEILDLFGVAEENVQELWVQKGKERWEFDKRYEYMRPNAWPLFEKAGLISEAYPKKERYDYAVVFGALLSRVEDRVDYLADLWNQGIRFNRIIFLTGQRPLLEREKSVCGAEMETEMVKWVYSQSALPKEVPILFIDAPQKMRDGIWVRPDTKDTVSEWLKTHPDNGSVIAISNQPYVGYQKAVIQSLLPNGFEVDAAGPAVKGEPTVALILDTIAKQLFFDTQFQTSLVPVH